ncbi:MAG: 2-C-methyl-D-erythritol 2,4-cyclodiphosphate synthase [Candidatus Cryptobacteroides sp.]
MGTDFRIGHGYDVHAIAPGLRMVLCGVEIEGSAGFVAHSDGDVAIHALCDALLGALALGDIGRHFPDSAQEYAGIDSRILLGRVMELVRGRGWELGNADITIALQRPKLAPYILRMRESLAGVIGCPQEDVSVKATTTEKLGFVGRGEGCEVHAVVLLRKTADF